MDTHQGPFASADNEDLIKLVRTMVSGFQEFSVELKQLHLKTSKLEEKVSLLHDKVIQEGRFSSGQATSVDPGDNNSILRAAGIGRTKHSETAELSSCGSLTPENPREQENVVSDHVQTCSWPADSCAKKNEPVQSDSSISYRRESRKPKQAGLSRERSPELSTQGPPRCPFTAAGPIKQHHSTAFTLPSHHESYVDNAARNDSRTASHPPSDPIEAELHGRRPSTGVQSASESAHKCPIRFLSYHSAEEVAQYFERHKHEIPRSHEVCVRRHQNNEETIRQLDAKYGNLVSMIQDLGLKHQPLLPGKDDDEPTEGDENANRSVEEWAGEVNKACRGSSIEEPLDSRDRELHSDHPLKEVRLGESPSRPWGISVPVNEGLSGNIDLDASFQKDGNPTPHDADALDRSRLRSTRTGEHYTGDGVGSGPPKKARGSVSQPEKHAQLGSGAAHILHTSRAQMTFTGPVFIGYQLDDVVTLLRHSATVP